MPDSSQNEKAGRSVEAIWLYLLIGLNVCSIAAAFILPLTLPDKTDGFAAAATAAMLFLTAMGLALLSGITALILGWRWRKAMTFRLTAIAFAMLPATILIIVIFFTYAIYRENA